MFTEPVNSEPLSEDLTTNPKFGETDAVTLPLAINADNNASSVNAERGISNNPLPLPVNIEADTLLLNSAEPVT